MDVVLVIVLDGALCSWVAPYEDRAGFHRAVHMGWGDPIVEAQEALRQRPRCRMVICSKRWSSLRVPTARWIGRHFPALAETPLVMRHDDDMRESDLVLVDQVAQARGGGRVVLVAAKEPRAEAQRAGDRLVMVKQLENWRMLDVTLSAVGVRS